MSDRDNSKNSSEDVKKRYDRIAPFYDILEGVMEKIAFSRWRQNFWLDIFKKIVLAKEDENNEEKRGSS